MLGESGFGTYVVYVLICLPFVLILVMFLRFTAMMSLLWIEPIVTILKRIPIVRRLFKSPTSASDVGGPKSDVSSYDGEDMARTVGRLSDVRSPTD